jgi:RNA polymerase sigma-70 factor (ECF subfamily)
MRDTETGEATGAEPRGLFATTRWSVVLAAQDKADPRSAEALEILCQSYWYPLYAYARRLGNSPQDAQDLTQEFFARLLAKNYLRGVDPARGRFRAFLQMAMKRFLANEWDRARTQKRGGGRTLIPFDSKVAEQRFVSEGDHALTPDRAYERRWALTLLEAARGRLEEEWRSAGKAEEWQQLKPHLTAERGGIPYETIAAGLNVSEGAARVAVHRLRRRFREIFRQAVADTVAEPGEIEAELGYILEILGRG